MLHRVIIAVDGSQNALRAVEYAGQVFGMNPESRLVLFSVLPVTSHLLLDKEEIKAIDARKVERPDLAGLYWRVQDEKKISGFFAEAEDLLKRTGVNAEQIKCKFKVKSGDVADVILEEVEFGKYRTLILGRRGLSRVKEFFLGSVSTKAVREARGCAVCVVA